ncbi:MAG: hypothetical protein C0483_05010 [Pirellula sp.]|nr:hypothetical protein [Pirellula sp.]
MHVARLILLHFGIAAAMAAGFTLWPVACSAAARFKSVIRRAPNQARMAARRSEQLRLLAALHDRRLTNSPH